MSHLLTEDILVVVAAPTATGTSAVEGAVVDMAGWDTCMFIARLGTPAANNSIKVQSGTDASVSDAADLAGTSVAHATNNQLQVEVFRPNERYLRPVITRGTGTTVDTLISIRGRGRSKSPAAPTGVSRETHISPAEGTA